MAKWKPLRKKPSGVKRRAAGDPFKGRKRPSVAQSQKSRV